jgi:hypothetical protein
MLILNDLDHDVLTQSKTINKNEIKDKTVYVS